MVTIVDFKQRVNAAGDPFFALIVQGGIELIQSQVTGQFYATARKASIVSTFNEEMCKKLIGTELPGTIERVSCTEYEWTVPATGETVVLNYTHRYNAQPTSIEETVFEGHPVPAQ
ncbi:MAG TPA: hypothetical protein PK711_10140 [Bacteroidales bacterium]|nr:hypothetical protein [Bacteroidales bacterium]